MDEYLLSELPGADLGWLRRILMAPAVPEHPPLTLAGIRQLRARLAIQVEHGVLSPRRAQGIRRMLNDVEVDVREYESGR